ncbi:MAG: ABC transporter permease [Gemmatimonadota bacterium]|nr:ABC transporter permease [Gemmatimonadota bacterium]
MMAVDPLVAASVRTTVPLLLAAGGELLSERAGILNIGLEGAVIAGALAATLGVGPWGLAGGYAAALCAGAAVGLLMALFVVVVRADQILTGTAATLLAFGVTGAVYRGVYGATGVALTLPTSAPFRIPVLAAIPGVGSALFDQPAVFYLAYLLVPILWWFLYRTQVGLALRAVGESPAAAGAAGIAAGPLRAAAVTVGSALGGLAGGVLVLAQAGTFAEGMSAGRGFIAIAIVVLGRWTPLGIMIGALVFGVATAMQYVVQAMGWPIRYELVLMLPYLLTLLALMFSPRGVAPAMLARSDV